VFFKEKMVLVYLIFALLIEVEFSLINVNLRHCTVSAFADIL